MGQYLHLLGATFADTDRVWAACGAVTQEIVVPCRLHIMYGALTSVGLVIFQEQAAQTNFSYPSRGLEMTVVAMRRASDGTVVLAFGPFVVQNLLR